MRKIASLVCAAGAALIMSSPAQAVQIFLNGSYEFQVQSYNNLKLDYTYAFQNGKDYRHNVGQRYDKPGYFRDPSDGTKFDTFYHQKHLSFQQRLTLQGTFMVSPNLLAYWDGIVGYITWGGPSQGSSGKKTGAVENPQLYGGALGTRSGSIITRQAFLDWTIPDTKIRLRFGQQYFSLPLFATGVVPINNEFGSGITVTAPITDWIDVIALWCHASSGPRRGAHLNFSSAKYSDDTWDIFALAPTFKFDGFKIMPSLGLSLIGKDAVSPRIEYPAGGAPRGLNGNYSTHDAYYNNKYYTYAFVPKLGADWGFVQSGDNWFPLYSAGAEANIERGTRHQVGNTTAVMLGLSGEITAADPWRFAWDFTYSQNKARHREWDRSGWSAGISASYKTKYGVPTIKLWYASGDDGNIFNGSERAVGGNGGCVDMTLWGQSTYGDLLHAYEGGSLFGTRGFSLQWNHLSFIDKLTHSIRLGFVQGTNNKKMAFYARRSAYGMESPGFAAGYLTTADRLIEIDFDTRYEIYKQLDAVLEASYMIADIDGNVWGKRQYAGGPLVENGKAHFSNPWRVSLLLRYRF